MPVVWSSHNKRQIFINVAVFTPDEAAGIIAQSTLSQSINIKMYRALVDTGATGTCITKKVAQYCCLSPIGKVQIIGVSGPKYHNNYLFNVGFTFAQQIGASSADGTKEISGVIHTVKEPIQSAEFDSGDAGFDVLLGMDVISIGSLKVEGDGTFSWAF